MDYSHEAGCLEKFCPTTTSNESIFVSDPCEDTEQKKAISLVKEDPTLKLIFNKLGNEWIQISSYTHASFANAKDLKSQLGFVTLLTDLTKILN